MRTSITYWLLVFDKEVLLPLINIVRYTRDCLLTADSWYTCREPTEFELKVKVLISKTYGASMPLLPLLEESTCVIYYYVYSLTLSGLLILFSIFLLPLALVDSIYFIQKHFRSCTKTEYETLSKERIHEYLGGSTTEQSGDICTVSWGLDKKLSLTCAFSDLEPSTDGMYLYKFPSTTTETAIALTEVKEKRSYINLRLRYIKNDVASYLFTPRNTFNKVLCYNATLFSFHILEHLLMGLPVVLYPILILGYTLWLVVSTVFVHPVLPVFPTVLSTSIYLATVLLFMLWTVQKMLLLVLYVVVGLVALPIVFVVSVLLLTSKVVWGTVVTVVSGVLVAFLLYVACTLKLFGYPVVGGTLLSSEVPERSMEALVQQTKKTPVVLRDDSFPSSDPNLFETVKKHHDTLESFSRALLAEMLPETLPQLAISCTSQASTWRGGSYTTSGLTTFLFQAVTSCYTIVSELYPYSYYVFGFSGGSSRFGSDTRDFPQYYSRGGRPKLTEYQKRVSSTDHRHLGELKVLTWESPYLSLFFYSSLFLLLLSFLLLVVLVLAVSVGHTSLQASTVFGVVTYTFFAVSTVLLDVSLFRRLESKVESFEVFSGKLMLVSIPTLTCFITSTTLTALTADGTLKSLSFSWVSATVITPLVAGVTLLVRSLLRSHHSLTALWSLLVLGLLALLLLVVSTNWDYPEQGVELGALCTTVGGVLGPGSLPTLLKDLNEDRDHFFVLGFALHYFSVPTGTTLVVAGAVDFYASSVTLVTFSVVKTLLSFLLFFGSPFPFAFFLLPDFYVMTSCALLISGEKSVMLCSIPIVVSSAVLCLLLVVMGKESTRTVRSSMRESGYKAMSTLVKEFPLVVAELLVNST